MTKLVRLRGAAAPGWAWLGARETSDATMAKINALPGVLAPLKAEDVVVRGVAVMNDAPFNDGRRRIRTAAVRRLVEMAVGVPVMLNHDTWSREAIPVGRTFEGSLRMEGGVTWGDLGFYMLRDVGGEELAVALDGGQITEASIGVYFRKSLCSIDDGSIWECDHQPGARYDGRTCYLEYDDPELFDEWSFVYRGAVKGTRFFRLAAAEQVESEDAEEAAARAFAKRPAEPPIPTLVERFAEGRRRRRERLSNWFHGRTAVGEGSGSPGA